MNIIKNKLFLFVSLFLLSYSVQAALITNSTDNLSLKIGNVSFNLFTLSLFADNFSIIEKKPVPREVLNVGNVKISLELARTLFLLRLQLDCFYIENIYVSILKDDNGDILLFNKNIKQEEIEKLFDSNTNKQAENETSIDLSIPEMKIKNLNITCSDHDKRTFLWSINNLNLYIYDFLSPPDKNKNLWSLFLSANFNQNTNSILLFSAKCRTFPDNSFLKMNIEAANIKWDTLDMIIDSGKNTSQNPKVTKITDGHKPKDEPSPFDTIFNCFSNEIGRISDAFSQKITDAKVNNNATNFFSNINISNLVFSFNWDMTVSNHIFKSGNIKLKMFDEKTNIPPLIYEYKITNSAELLVE